MWRGTSVVEGAVRHQLMCALLDIHAPARHDDSGFQASSAVLWTRMRAMESELEGTSGLQTPPSRSCPLRLSRVLLPCSATGIGNGPVGEVASAKKSTWQRATPSPRHHLQLEQGLSRRHQPSPLRSRPCLFASFRVPFVCCASVPSQFPSSVLGPAVAGVIH